MNERKCRLAAMALVLLLAATWLPMASNTAHALPWVPTGDYIEINVDGTGTPISIDYWRPVTEDYGTVRWNENNTNVSQDYEDWVTQIESESVEPLWTDTSWLAYSWSMFDPNFTADKLILVENYVTVNTALTFAAAAIGNMTPERNVTLNLATLAYARGFISLTSEMSKHSFKEITPTERVKMYRDFTTTYKALLIDMVTYYKTGSLPYGATKAVGDRLVSDPVKDEVGILNYNANELDATKRGRNWVFYYTSADEVGVGLSLAGGYLISKDIYLYKVAWVGYLLRGQLTITAVDDSNAPLANTLVTCTHTQHDYSVSGITDPQGQVTFTMPRGIYEVTLEHSGYLDTVTDDKVTFLAETESTYQLEPEPLSHKWLYWQYIIMGAGAAFGLMIITLAVVKNKKVNAWYRKRIKRKRK